VTDCRTDPTNMLFCPQCDALQPPSGARDYFAVFGLQPTFDLCVDELQQRYRQIQRSVHPDKYATSSQQEYSHALDQSSATNKAFHTLKSPLARGLYLLRLQGHGVQEGESLQDPAFLMAIMELNEELEEADAAALPALRKRNAESMATSIEAIKKAFAEDNLEDAREQLLRLRYYDNIERKLNERHEQTD